MLSENVSMRSHVLDPHKHNRFRDVAGTANRPPTTTTTTTTKSKWYPDHAVLSGATKDSLKNMAAFTYD